jgi:hypothetical protein
MGLAGGLFKYFLLHSTWHLKNGTPFSYEKVFTPQKIGLPTRPGHCAIHDCMTGALFKNYVTLICLYGILVFFLRKAHPRNFIFYLHRKMQVIELLMFPQFWSIYGNWSVSRKGKVGKRFGTSIWDPSLGPQFGTPIRDPNLGPWFETPVWDPDLGSPFWTLILDLILGHPHFGPLFWTLI